MSELTVFYGVSLLDSSHGSVFDLDWTILHQRGKGILPSKRPGLSKKKLFMTRNFYFHDI